MILKNRLGDNEERVVYDLGIMSYRYSNILKYILIGLFGSVYFKWQYGFNVFFQYFGIVYFSDLV